VAQHRVTDQTRDFESMHAAEAGDSERNDIRVGEIAIGLPEVERSRRETRLPHHRPALRPQTRVAPRTGARFAARPN